MTAGAPLYGARAHHSVRHSKKHVEIAPRVAVTPSPLIEERIREELRRSEAILATTTADNVLASGFLVSAMYYHDGIFQQFNPAQPDGDPTQRVVTLIVRDMPASSKGRFMSTLHEICNQRAGELGPAGFVVPLSYEAGSARRRSHRDAVDLFAREGSLVHTATHGLVVLADRNWNREDPFSTSSMRGGNAVIVFDPDTDRFYRYCHLDAVFVQAGDIVEFGEPIGTVGHTGFNASRPRHGGHLHFEVNSFDGQYVRSFQAPQLWSILRSTASMESASGTD